MTHSNTPETPSAERAFHPNRRDVVKAASGLGIAAASGVGISHLPQSDSQIPTAAAQEVDGTRGRSWSEADNINTSIKLEGEGWVTLQAEFPFWALGFAWDDEEGTWPVVEYGISFDGVSWDEGYRIDAHDDGGPPPTDERHHTALHFCDGQQYVRYRTVDGEGNLVVLDRFQVTYIDPTDGPWEKDRPATMMRTTATNTDTRIPPKIITRGQWGANEDYRFDSQGEVWPPEYSEVQHAIVHHAAVNYSSDGNLAVRSIYYYHAITQGWGDIGYNYLVDTSGRIYEGRVGGANVIGGHAFQYAVGSSGICVMGDFRYADAPHAAKVALANIVAYVTRDLDPHGTNNFHEVLGLPTIAAHRDVVMSTCPGDGLYDDMGWLRNTVADILDRGDLDSGMPGGIVPGDWVKIQTDDGSALQMYGQPGTDQIRVDQIPDGSRVEVEEGPRSDGNHNWYLVMYNNREGWVQADYLVVDPPEQDSMPGYTFGENIRLGANVALKTSPSTNANTRATESNSWAMLLAGPYPAGGTEWFEVQTQNGQYGWITINQFDLADVTSPSSTYDIGTEVETVRRTNIRVRPGLPQTVQGVVGAGARLTISVAPVGVTGRTWYGVSGGTGVGGGWVDSTDINLPPQPVTGTGQRYRVTETMNFRNGAGLGAAVIGSLTAGSTGDVIGGPVNSHGYRWWNLRTDNGSVGWAASNWLVRAAGEAQEPSDPPPSSGGKFNIGDTGRVTEALNMRTGASTGHGVIAVLPVGTRGRIAAGPSTGSGYTWWRIETGYGSGWVVQDWVANEGGSDSGDQDPPPSSGAKFEHGDGARVTEGLNIRTGAGTGNGVITVLPAGTTGEIVDGPRSANGYTWWRISTGYGTGWVVENWIANTGSSSPSEPSDPPPSSGSKFDHGDNARVTEGLNMRTGAGTGNGVITVLPAGTTGEIVDGPQSASGYTWWRIETSYGTGWVVENWISPTSSSSGPRFSTGDTGTVTEPLHLRSGAGTNNSSITILPVGTTGEVIDGPRSASGYTWWRIETSYGTGWVAQDWFR